MLFLWIIKPDTLSTAKTPVVYPLKISFIYSLSSFHAKSIKIIIYIPISTDASAGILPSWHYPYLQSYPVTILNSSNNSYKGVSVSASSNSRFVAYKIQNIT